MHCTVMMLDVILELLGGVREVIDLFKCWRLLLCLIGSGVVIAVFYERIANHSTSEVFCIATFLGGLGLGLAWEWRRAR